MTEPAAFKLSWPEVKVLTDLEARLTAAGNTKMATHLLELIASSEKSWQDETRINGHCLWCRDTMPVPNRRQGGGRSKKYCSAACKQAALRHRNNSDLHPDAQTWLIRNRPNLFRQASK